jgi:hypothetical protein
MLRRGTAATVVLVRDAVQVASWPLVAPASPDLRVVDELARLQLAARRLGCSIRLQDPIPGLSQLLDLVGLRVEVGGEPEGGKEVGVEEVVMPDDSVG